jgi:hypothetical protein
LARLVYIAINVLLREVNNVEFRNHSTGMKLLEYLKDLDLGNLQMGQFSQIVGSDSLILLIITVWIRMKNPNLKMVKVSDETIDAIAARHMDRLSSFMEDHSKWSLSFLHSQENKIHKSHEEQILHGRTMTQMRYNCISNNMIARLTKLNNCVRFKLIRTSFLVTKNQ